MIAIIGIIVFLVLLFLGMNIGLAMLLVGFVGYAYMINFNAAMGVLRTAPVDTAAKYSYIVIPLFILMGNFAYHAGLSGNLYDAASKWLSRLPGGLACATVAACAVFGAICGSTAATAATMGAIALPEMRKRGYNDAISTGSLCIGGTLGVMIPPSTPMIIYAIIAECSIGKLFSAGILPGIILAVMYIIIIVVRCTIHKDWAPAPTSTPWKERLISLKGLISVVILFGVTLGGMFAGFFSVNQASCIGAFLALIIMAVNRRLNWKSFFTAMKDTVTTTAMTMLIMMGAMVFCAWLAIHRPARLDGFCHRRSERVQVCHPADHDLHLHDLGYVHGRHGYDHSDRSYFPARCPGPGLGRHLVRYLHHCGHGDGLHHASCGPEPVRHLQDREGHPPAHYLEGRDPIYLCLVGRCIPICGVPRDCHIYPEPDIA